MTTAADTILAAVRAVVPVDVKVYDSIVTSIPPARYVVLYIPGGLRMATGVDAVSDAVYLEFQTTTVASDGNPSYSAAMCRWLANTVRDGLTDLIITPDGWRPARIQHVGSQSPQPDEQTPEKKVYATDQFAFTTVRVA